jgi:hypothetical protein
MEKSEKISSIIGDVLAEIEAIRVAHGSPELGGGTSTDCGAPTQALYDASCHDIQLDDDSIALHNACIERLYATIGIRHVGSGMWICDYETTPEWDSFVDEARLVINEFANFSFWDKIEPMMSCVEEA